MVARIFRWRDKVNGIALEMRILGQHGEVDVFRLNSCQKSLLALEIRNAKSLAVTVFAAVSLVSACKPLLQGSDSTDLSLSPEKEEDALERLIAKQNTALKTYMLQSTTASNESCLIPEGTQLVADAIKPEGIDHWRVFSLGEIRLPSGEVGRRTRVSNESAPGSVIPAASSADNPQGDDKIPNVISKTPSELLNCPLLEKESFLVFSAHFTRQAIVDPQKKPAGGGLAGATNPSSSPQNGDDSWQWPTRGRTIRNDSGGSGYFNAPRASGRGHQGIDIVAAVGEAVYATRSGTIVDPAWEGAYGKVVDVQHQGGYLSRYAHLSSFTYSHGTYVEKGARIATAGRTGNASGSGITPHLHFEIRRGGRVVNPRSLLP
ncbi:MAG: hypothetical protein RI932_2520 [Pseudomonadota bacterium]|jgi:murein DD-endopeptidase MepM/ murein hydrolase activator NlpD